jgi:hypothetical protein
MLSESQSLGFIGKKYEQLFNCSTKIYFKTYSKSKKGVIFAKLPWLYKTMVFKNDLIDPETDEKYIINELWKAVVVYINRKREIFRNLS